jgi:translation initiation factor IF-1
MTGKIIKGIGGFYYVVCENGITYECKAKGVFRNRKIKPLVGDNVEIEILDENRIRVSIDDYRWKENELVGHRSKYAIISNGHSKKIIKQSDIEKFKDWTVLKFR